MRLLEVLLGDAVTFNLLDALMMNIVHSNNVVDQMMMIVVVLVDDSQRVIVVSVHVDNNVLVVLMVHNVLSHRCLDVIECLLDVLRLELIFVLDVTCRALTNVVGSVA